MDYQTKVRVLAITIRKMLDEKRLPYQLKLKLYYFKQAQFSKASVCTVRWWQQHYR